MQCGVRPKFARAIKKEPTISRRRRRCRRRWVAASSESQSLLIRNAQEQTIWFGWTHRLQIYCISDQRGPHRRKMKNGECCTLLKVRATAGTVAEILKSRSILVAVLFQSVCRVHSPKGACLQIPRPTVQINDWPAATKAASNYLHPRGRRRPSHPGFRHPTQGVNKLIGPPRFQQRERCENHESIHQYGQVPPVWRLLRVWSVHHTRLRFWTILIVATGTLRSLKLLSVNTFRQSCTQNIKYSLQKCVFWDASIIISH